MPRLTNVETATRTLVPRPDRKWRCAMPAPDWFWLIVAMLLSLLLGSWGWRPWSLSLAMLPWLGFAVWVSWRM